MKHKKLPTQEQLKHLFNYNLNTGDLIRKVTINNRAKAGDIISSSDNEGYLQVCINYEPYRVHRVIYKLWYGDFDESMQIDHLDRRTGNNRIDNLRLVTPHINCHNRGKTKHNTSGHTGVDMHQGYWRARICIKGKRKELGSFILIDSAVKARKKAEIELGYLHL